LIQTSTYDVASNDSQALAGDAENHSWRRWRSRWRHEQERCRHAAAGKSRWRRRNHRWRRWQRQGLAFVARHVIPRI